MTPHVLAPVEVYEALARLFDLPPHRSIAKLVLTLRPDMVPIVEIESFIRGTDGPVVANRYTLVDLSTGEPCEFKSRT